MADIVGIDLGTTNSLCAIFRDGQPVLIPNAHGEFLTPSIVGILDDDQVLVGAAARELRVTRPERCQSTFKRHMGSDRKLKIGDKTFTAVDLSSLVLRSLKVDAEAFLGRRVKEAVITVPAYFNDLQRKATRRAGELAGLRVRRIINEPTAAALTYGFHDRKSDKKLFIIDLGGGTFDVTLLEVFEGSLEIISTAGESFLGGEDFTDRLAATVLKGQGLELEAAEMKSPLLVSRLRQECELAKRRLLDAEEAVIRLPNSRGLIDEGAKTVTLTRQEFATVVQPLLDRVKGPIGKTLRDGRCEPADLEDVILVGGATRMPAMRKFVADYFQREPLCRFNPDEVVALGAAVQAALIADDAAVEDMVMTDVCPFTLGVEVGKEFAMRHMDGYFMPIIHRNTTIPVSCERDVVTVSQNQQEMTIRVYQGEGRRVQDNLLLGQVKVTGIPNGPAGQHVSIRFTYDVNGILEVEAFLPPNGKKFTTVIKNNAQDLTEDEVEATLARMRELKFYPRDDVVNQRLLLFAEKAVGEVSQYDRESLEEALDLFEVSMASGDRVSFASAREGLLMVLASLGVHYDGDVGATDAEG